MGERQGNPIHYAVQPNSGVPAEELACELTVLYSTVASYTSICGSPGYGGCLRESVRVAAASKLESSAWLAEYAYSRLLFVVVRTFFFF